MGRKKKSRQNKKSVAKSQNASRFWEIDSMRGVAIIMMVIYHLMWDLWVFRVLPDVVLTSGFWKYFQLATASNFIFLVGVSLTVSYRRAKDKASAETQLYPRFSLRGLRILGWGVVITLVVWLAGMGFIHFGVLHFIGVSIILAYPFLNYRLLNVIVGIILLLVGQWIGMVKPESLGLDPESLWLVWLGITPERYYPNDFFPLLPWFGLVLLGIAAGNILYSTYQRNFSLPDLSHWLPFKSLEFLGRYSLPIYIIHQPLLIALLAAFGIINFG